MESYNQSSNPKDAFESQVSQFLELPSKRDFENPDRELASELGEFLMEEDFIKGIDVWKGSWGFAYDSGNRTIYTNEHPISEENYKHYIFRLGENDETGEYLFPEIGRETDQYRFLHEVSHAYQAYLIEKESEGKRDEWHGKAVSHEINSTFGVLFEYCYKKRKETDLGISTWGNISDYNSEPEPEQTAVRAIEDANELITMYLWNPKYLDVFLDYISLDIEGFDESNLKEDKLRQITQKEKNGLKQLITEYVREMKENIT